MFYIITTKTTSSYNKLKYINLMNQLPNLLIVDDLEVNLELLESIIKKIDVNLIRARSGS